jgi:hypothetical protein
MLFNKKFGLKTLAILCSRPFLWKTEPLETTRFFLDLQIGLNSGLDRNSRKPARLPESMTTKAEGTLMQYSCCRIN